MKIAIVCCLHGNESYGLEVVKKLPASIPFFIANKKALKENKRFIEADLNRCFPGSKFGNYEEKLANGLKNKLSKFNYILDLHSSSNNCPLFGIITNPNKEKIEFAQRLGLKRLVIMNESVASGKSLIDYVKLGISLEIGPHQKVENEKEVLDLIYNLIENKNYSRDLEIYEVFKIVKKEKNEVLINNFDEIKKGQIIAKNNDEKQYAEEDFIAILVNEEAYKNTLCLAARKLINF
ncbi:MAG: succinylglutamate desuccinylase/aspartoacylase family protein [Nanoarchaeota archaeon]|nr:succinylglutamate desuccinylase/aspartoacylase family protein [Nanoarchaeota archaeon]